MKVGDLKAAAYNPRKISEAQEKALKLALEVFGDLGGVVFNQKTGNLVSGHQRVKTLDKSWPIRIDKTFSPADKCGTIGVGVIETPFGELGYRVVEWDEKVERAANLIGDAAAQERANAQRAKMEGFFNGLNGFQKRRLRQAARRITGKTETISQMSARLALESKKP